MYGLKVCGLAFSDDGKSPHHLRPPERQHAEFERSGQEKECRKMLRGVVPVEEKLASGERYERKRQARSREDRWPEPGLPEHGRDHTYLRSGFDLRLGRSIRQCDGLPLRRLERRG